MDFRGFYDFVSRNSGGDDDVLEFVYNDFRECRTPPDRRYLLQHYEDRTGLFRQRARTTLFITSSQDGRAAPLTKRALLGYLERMEPQVDPESQLVVNIDGVDCLHDRTWARIESPEENLFVLSDGGSWVHDDGDPNSEFARWSFAGTVG